MARRPDAGQLRDQVRIDRRDEATTDSWGNPSPATWQTLVAPQPARIMPVRGNEQVLADRLTGVVVYEITLRWTAANAAISAGDRMVVTRENGNIPVGTALDILHEPVNPDSRKRWLTMQVRRGAAVG